MRTCSSSHVIAESSTTLKRRNHRRSKQRVESFSLEETSVVTMADQRTMAELLQAPTEGYGDAIVIPSILAENFKLKRGLLNLVTSKQYYGFEKEDPLAHIRWFNKITSMIKYKDVPNSSIKLMLFPFSIEGAARIWLKKEPLVLFLLGKILFPMSANTSSSITACSSEMAALTDAVNAMLRHVKTSPPKTPQQPIIRIKDIVLKET
ncbi:hypothetical protein Tco_1241764 [Tanacetum coccineum]